MRKSSILIADDEVSIRTYLTRFLTSCGYEVESVDSGDGAIARLNRAPSPDLVLLEEPQAAVYSWLTVMGEKWRKAVRVSSGSQLSNCL